MVGKTTGVVCILGANVQIIDPVTRERLNTFLAEETTQIGGVGPCFEAASRGDFSASIRGLILSTATVDQ